MRAPWTSEAFAARSGQEILDDLFKELEKSWKNSEQIQTLSWPTDTGP
jgi:hypothetical protein